MNSIPSRSGEFPVGLLLLSAEQLFAEASEVPDTIGLVLPGRDAVRRALADGRTIDEQLMRVRWLIFAAALRHGATLAQVAAGTGLGSEDLRDGLCAFVRTVPRTECRDCGHSFSLESSPHFDRCWECAESADAGGVL